MRFSLSSLFLTIALFLSGCDSPMNNRIIEGEQGDKSLVERTSFQSSALEAQIQWIDGPHGDIKKSNHIMVFLYKDGNLYSLPQGQSLEFYATMPSMGHPMEDAGFFTEVDTGIYVNKTIRYNMPGDWKNELWVMDKDFNILDRLIWDSFF